MLHVTDLNHNLKTLKRQRHNQEELIRQYELEIAFLKHQVELIKENADLLPEGCFKTRKLEP